MDRNADDFGNRIGWRGTLQEVFVPVSDRPIDRRRPGDTGEGQGWGEDMFAEAGVRILGVERIDQENEFRFWRGSGFWKIGKGWGGDEFWRKKQRRRMQHRNFV